MPKTMMIAFHRTAKIALPLLKGKARLNLKHEFNQLLYNSHLPFYLGDGRFCSINRSSIFVVPFLQVP